ncbi:hypothetical protein BconGalA64_06740 [Burkholderia contaminans]|nr:hypothetical protein BconGalA64_06740 [Burkholderia contaminans]
MLDFQRDDVVDVAFLAHDPEKIHDRTDIRIANDRCKLRARVDRRMLHAHFEAGGDRGRRFGVRVGRVDGRRGAAGTRRIVRQPGAGFGEGRHDRFSSGRRILYRGAARQPPTSDMRTVG